MSQPTAQTSATATDEGPACFSASDYFLGLARKIVANQESMHVSLPERGEVIIVPERNEYFARIAEMAEFCQAPATNFRLAHPKKEDYARLSSSGQTGHIRELLWEAAFHASQGRLVGSRSNEEDVHPYDVIRFHHWPNLTKLSQTPNTMRICALLTREPSSIMLVSRKLGIEPSEMYKVYSAACSYGIVNVISNHLGQADVQASIDDEDADVDAPHSRSLIRALFTKIAGL